MLTKIAYTNDSSLQFFFNVKVAQFHEKNTRNGRATERVYPITVYGTKISEGVVVYSEIAGDIENGFAEVSEDLVPFSDFEEDRSYYSDYLADKKSARVDNELRKAEEQAESYAALALNNFLKQEYEIEVCEEVLADPSATPSDRFMAKQKLIFLGEIGPEDETRAYLEAKADYEEGSM